MSNSPVKISIKVTPGSSRNQVVGFTNGIWRLKIAAAPDKGKANKELIEYLSQILGLKKDCIEILKGETSHHKIISITGLSAAEIAGKLAER